MQRHLQRGRPAADEDRVALLHQHCGGLADCLLFRGQHISGAVTLEAPGSVSCDLSAAVKALDLAVPSQYLQVPAHGGGTDCKAGRYLIHRRVLA